MVYDSARKYKMIKDFEDKRQKQQDEADRLENLQTSDYNWKKDYKIWSFRNNLFRVCLIWSNIFQFSLLKLKFKFIMIINLNNEIRFDLNKI